MRIPAYGTRIYFATALVIVSLTSAAAFGDGPVGTWNISVVAEGQENEGTLIIVEKDGKYSGTVMSEELGEIELSDVSYVDGKLSFTMDIEQMGATAGFTATIDGDSLEGKFTVADMGIEAIATGTRVDVSEREDRTIVDLSDTTKFEFCSEAWVALARDYLVTAVGDADFGDARFSCCETFSSTTRWRVARSRSNLPPCHHSHSTRS